MKNISKLFFFIYLVSFLTGCLAKNNKEQETIMEYPVVLLTTIDTVLEKEYVAQIQSVKNVEIRSQANGFLNKIFVDEGKYVKEGQLLFQLNAERYKNEVDKNNAMVGSAEAEMLAADVEVRRVKILAEKNIISKTELELAEAKFKIAKAKVAESRANLSNAQLMLSYAFVKAPFSGVINRIPLKIGSLVDEGTLLTTISDVESMFTYFNLSEREYLQYVDAKKKDSAQHSNNVHLELADGLRFPLVGKIETMETEINSSTGSLAFRARFQNMDNKLKHGSTGKVFLSTVTNNVMLIPQKSVFEIQDKNYVYVLDADNKVSVKNIVPEARAGNSYIIRDGLKPGDRILYEGNQTIREGQRITPKPVPWRAND